MTRITPITALKRNRHARRRTLADNIPAAPLVDPVTPAANGDRLAPSASLHRLPNALGQAALLEWLGQSPITFHRAYVDITGGVLPALWLSCAMVRVASASASEFERNGDFIFEMSSSECERETGISRGQQASCRRHLIAQGLMSEQAEQRKATRYRLHLDRIARKLLIQAGPLAESLQMADAYDLADFAGHA